MPKVKYEEIGQELSYQQVWDYQSELHDALKLNKRAWRDNESLKKAQMHHLLMCEHPHVYTLGKSGSEDHLLIDQQERDEKEVSYYKINRGGDITYHGPGQLTVYPILDLDEFYNDLHRYVRELEEAVIRMLVTYGLEGYREEKYTGVWLAANDKFPVKRKICAIGVHMSRWVSLHGIALNVNTDLNMFQHIIPCGIVDEDKTVTSISQELGKKIDMQDAKSRLKATFADVFDFTYTNE